MEHPEDWGRPPFASLFDTDELLGVEERTSSERRLLDQCCFDCVAKKGTCLTGTLHGLKGEPLRCTGDHVHAYQHGVVDGVPTTRRLQRFSSAFSQWFAEMILHTLADFNESGGGPTGWRRTTVPSQRISAWSTLAADDDHEDFAFLNECVARGQHVDLKPNSVAAYLHVDDGIIIADGDGVVNVDWHADEVAKGLSHFGFVVHDVD